MIHEEIDESLQEISKKNKNVIISRIVQYIVHLGYLRNKIELKQKHERYAAIAHEQIAKNPQDSSTHYSLGTHYNVNGERDRALYHWQKAVEINPNYSSALNDIGVYYFYEGNFKKAKEYFLRAKESLGRNCNQALRRRVDLNLKDMEMVERRFKSMTVAIGDGLQSKGTVS